MTDQDPTQRYDLPPAEQPSADAPPTIPAPEVEQAASAIEPARAAPPPPSAPAPFTTDRAQNGDQPVRAAPTSPVAAAAAARPGRSPIRWIVAAVVSLLVVGTAAGATFLLTRESGDPEVLGWTPADSVIYTELRLDLPGDQQAELAKAMSAFPGFADQAAFPTKLNEALDQLVKRASDGKMSYQADIEPWFGGQVSLSVGAIPTSNDPKTARGLVLASVKDGAKASAWATKLLSDVGATTTTETYNGVTITVVTPPASSQATGSSMTGAFAVLGPVIAVGDTASVKAAIDTKGTTGLATNAQFKAASASVSGDRLGFAYVDTAAIAKGVQALGGAAVASAMPQLPALLGDLSAPWTAAALHAKGGAFVVDTRKPHVEKLGPATTAESKLPSVLPPTTVALAEGHDVGQTVERLKSLAAADPALAAGVKQVDDTLQIVGGLGSIVDWMGEAGVAVTRSGNTVAGGLVITPTDKAAADKLFTQLRGFLVLGGASAGIKVTDETYGDVTITILDLSGLGNLAGAATGGAVSNVPSNISIAYAVTDQVVVLGSGTDFVKAVLDARNGDSLAKSQRFSDALSRVDKAHGSLMWLDVAGLRDFLEQQIPAADKTDYQANAKPYLDAFDSIISTGTPGSDLDRGTLVIIVKSS